MFNIHTLLSNSFSLRAWLFRTTLDVEFVWIKLNLFSERPCVLRGQCIAQLMTSLVYPAVCWARPVQYISAAQCWHYIRSALKSALYTGIQHHLDFCEFSNSHRLTVCWTLTGESQNNSETMQTRFLNWRWLCSHRIREIQPCVDDVVSGVACGYNYMIQSSRVVDVVR